MCNISLDAKPERDLKASVVAVKKAYPVFTLIATMKANHHYNGTFNKDEINTIAQYIHLAEFEKFGG